MKHGLKPTRRQKEFLSSKKLNYKNWLIVKDTTEKLEIVHRVTNKTRSYYKK